MRRLSAACFAVSLLLGGCAGQSTLPNGTAPTEPHSDSSRILTSGPPVADLSITVFANRRTTEAGSTVTFTMVGKNNGPNRSTLDTHAIPSKNLQILSIYCAFNVSSDGDFCEPGVAGVGAAFTTVVVARVVHPGNADMKGCVLSEGDTADPLSENNCATVRVLGKP